MRQTIELLRNKRIACRYHRHSQLSFLYLIFLSLIKLSVVTLKFCSFLKNLETFRDKIYLVTNLWIKQGRISLPVELVSCEIRPFLSESTRSTASTRPPETGGLMNKGFSFYRYYLLIAININWDITQFSRNNFQRTSHFLNALRVRQKEYCSLLPVISD